LGEAVAVFLRPKQNTGIHFEQNVEILTVESWWYRNVTARLSSGR